MNNIPLQMSDLTSLFSNSDLLLRSSLAFNFFAAFFVLLVLSLVLARFLFRGAILMKKKKRRLCCEENGICYILQT